MKFSIIIPSYNQGRFIGETLDSIFNQKGDFEIECLVFDGGSTDNTINILKDYDQKIINKYYHNNKGIFFNWISKKDNGQTDAINQGLKKATGDIHAYINSDDTYSQGSFKKVIDSFSQNPDKKWITGSCIIINEKNVPIRSVIGKYKNFWLNRYSYKKLLVLNYISQPSTFWKKEITTKYGLFNEKLQYTMDYEYWLRIGKNNQPIISKFPLANFRIHGQSKGETSYIKQFKQDYEVCTNYCNNRSIRFLHSLHNRAIILIYGLIKN